MANVSIGEAVGSGFSLIRRRPAAVLVWGVVLAAALVGYVAALLPVYLNMARRALALREGGQPTPMDLGSIVQGEGIVYLAIFALLIVYTVVIAAALRSMLDPAASRFAYLRIGMTELMLFFSAVVFYVIVFVAELVIGLPIMIAVVALGVGKATMAAILVGVVGFIGFLIAVVYLHLRLSVAWPMIVETGKFRLFESWAITRGRVWPIFLTLLSIYGIVLAVYLLVFGVFAVTAGGMIGTPASVADFPSIIARLTPLFFVGVLISIPVSGGFLAVYTAPWANLYLQFRRLDGEAILA